MFINILKIIINYRLTPLLQIAIQNTWNTFKSNSVARAAVKDMNVAIIHYLRFISLCITLSFDI